MISPSRSVPLKASVLSGINCGFGNADFGHGSNRLAFNDTGDDPDNGYFTEYASDRPDKTDHVWDWLFKQKLSGQVGRADINKTLQEIND